MSEQCNRTYSNYRWVIGVVLFMGLMGLNILWFIPSPLLPVIMKQLRLTLTEGGLGMSVVCLLVAVFSFVGGNLVERMGAKRCFLLGLWFMAVGAALTSVVTDFGMLFLSRVLVGIGFGLCLPVSGAVIMMWFPEKERPYMNTINSALPYVATAITFGFTVPMYQVLHSWRWTIAVWGFFLMATALAWSIWGREAAEDKEGALDQAEQVLAEGPKENLLLSVWKNREVKLLSIAEAGDMWSFQFLSSMLPTYYTVEAGLTMSTASTITALFPLTGIAAGLLCGFWMSRVGLRRPFTWPMHLITFIGTFLAINAGGGWRLLGVAMAGFGNAGWAPALFTMPMEFADMNPARVGAVYAIMLGLGFISAFVSPWLGGWLAQYISLHNTIFLFSFSSLIAALCTFLMKETGPAAWAK